MSWFGQWWPRGLPTTEKKKKPKFRNPLTCITFSVWAHMIWCCVISRLQWVNEYWCDFLIINVYWYCFLLSLLIGQNFDIQSFELYCVSILLCCGQLRSWNVCVVYLFASEFQNLRNVLILASPIQECYWGFDLPLLYYSIQSKLKSLVVIAHRWHCFWIRYSGRSAINLSSKCDYEFNELIWEFNYYWLISGFYFHR